MTRYRVEVYDPDFNFISFGGISTKDIKIDYLTEENSVIEVTDVIEAHVNDYLALKQDGKLFMYGIIANVEYSVGRTSITFIHFMKYLNVDIMEDAAVFQTLSAEEWLHNRLMALYAGSDDFQNIHGFSCEYNSTTMIDYEATSDPGTMETVNLFTFIQMLLQKYMIMVTWRIDFTTKTVKVVIGKIDTESVWTLKLGIADAPEYSIDIHSIEGAYNKIKYFNEEDLSNTVTYFLHTDGSIDDDSASNRLIPVTYTEKTAAPDTTEGEEKTFEEVALLDAQASMMNTDFNHEIIVTFNADSKLVPVGELGQLYRLITPEGVAYNTVLTGYESVNISYLKLMFGLVRTDLTTILKIKRRR